MSNFHFLIWFLTLKKSIIYFWHIFHFIMKFFIIIVYFSFPSHNFFFHIFFSKLTIFFLDRNGEEAFRFSFYITCTDQSYARRDNHDWAKFISKIDKRAWQIKTICNIRGPAIIVIGNDIHIHSVFVQVNNL